MKKKRSLHKKKVSRVSKTSNKNLYKVATIVFLSCALVILASSIPVTSTVHSTKGVLGDEVQSQQDQPDQPNQQQQTQGDTQNTKDTFQNPPSNNNNTDNNNPRTQSRPDGNSREIDIQGQNGENLHAKVADNGNSQPEMEQNSLKLQYSVEDGQPKLSVEDKNGSASAGEVESLQKQIENELNQENIHIATGEGGITLSKNNVSALTRFPLSVNAATKQLTVTTPNGQKVVTVLPDQAVQNLINTGVVNTVPGAASGSAQVSGGNSNIQIEMFNNQPVYKIEGEKVMKLFGFIPVTSPITAFVSTQTGVPVATQQSVLSNILSSLSF